MTYTEMIIQETTQIIDGLEAQVRMTTNSKARKALQTKINEYNEYLKTVLDNYYKS